MGELAQPLIGFPKNLFNGGAILALLGRRFFALGRLAKIADEGDGEDAHVGGGQLLLNELPVLRGRRVDAGGEKNDGLFSRERREPIYRSGEAGGEIEVTEAKREIHASQDKPCLGFVRREIEEEFRGFRIGRDGDAIGRRDAGKKSVRGTYVVLAEKEDGGTGFHQEHELSRFFDGQEVGDGLLDTVVEDVEIFAAEAGDEMTGRVGDGGADVYAIDGDADGRSGFLRLSTGQRGCEEQKEQDSQDWLSHRGFFRSSIAGGLAES